MIGNTTLKGERWLEILQNHGKDKERKVEKLTVKNVKTKRVFKPSQ